MEDIKKEDLNCLDFDSNTNVDVSDEIDILIKDSENVLSDEAEYDQTEVACNNCGVNIVMLKSTQELIDGSKALPARTDDDDIDKGLEYLLITFIVG